MLSAAAQANVSNSTRFSDVMAAAGLSHRFEAAQAAAFREAINVSVTRCVGRLNGSIPPIPAEPPEWINFTHGSMKRFFRPINMAHTSDSTQPHAELHSLRFRIRVCDADCAEQDIFCCANEFVNLGIGTIKALLRASSVSCPRGSGRVS